MLWCSNPGCLWRTKFGNRGRNNDSIRRCALILGKRLVAPPPQPVSIAGSRWDIAILAFAGIIAITGIFNEPRFNSSFVKYVLLDVRYLFDDNSYPLDWDATSYHLPALIEFLQKGTAWSFDGPYQSYCFGFEFLAALPLMEFHSTFGMILSNLLATALITVSSVCLVRMLIKAIGCEDLSTFSICAAFLMSYLLVEDRTWNFGKNDNFITGCYPRCSSIQHPIGDDRSREFARVDGSDPCIPFGDGARSCKQATYARVCARVWGNSGLCCCDTPSRMDRNEDLASEDDSGGNLDRLCRRVLSDPESLFISVL